MKKGLYFIWIILTCGIFAFSCQNKGKGTIPMSPSEEAIESDSVSTLTEQEENSMIASVNGSVITLSEVQREMDSLLGQFKGEVPPEQLEQIMPKLWKKALENLINIKLLLQAADREKIQPDQEAIDVQMEQISDRFPDSEKFREQLASLGISEKDLRKEIEESQRIETLLESQTEKISEVDKEEVDDFYRKNPENFKIPETIRASHILISIDPNDGPKEKDEKRKNLSHLRDEIVNGSDFAQMARENSDCPSSSNGGDLGQFERGKMVKPFEDAAFQLKVGELSGIVETEFGYHLIKVTDHQDARSLPLEEVRDKIVSYLNRQRRNQAVDDYLLKLRNDAQIDYAEDS